MRHKAYECYICGETYMAGPDVCGAAMCHECNLDKSRGDPRRRRDHNEETARIVELSHQRARACMGLPDPAMTDVRQWKGRALKAEAKLGGVE